MARNSKWDVCCDWRREDYSAGDYSAGDRDPVALTVMSHRAAYGGGDRQRAAFNATGKRARDLPITPDKLL